jgi:hypothetical protein
MGFSVADAVALAPAVPGPAAGLDGGRRFREARGVVFFLGAMGWEAKRSATFAWTMQYWHSAGLCQRLS